MQAFSHYHARVTSTSRRFQTGDITRYRLLPELSRHAPRFPACLTSFVWHRLFVNWLTGICRHDSHLHRPLPANYVHHQAKRRLAWPFNKLPANLASHRKVVSNTCACVVQCRLLHTQHGVPSRPPPPGGDRVIYRVNLARFCPLHGVVTWNVEAASQSGGF